MGGGARATAGSLLRLENANRREAREIASRRAIVGSEKALALVGPSASSGVGDTRRLIGALPVRGENVYAKRGDPTTGCRDRKKAIERHALFYSTTAIVVVSKHACSSNDDTLQPVGPVAYQVNLEPGIGQFREFEPGRVHTSKN